MSSLERRSGYDRRQEQQSLFKEGELLFGEDITTIEDIEIPRGETREVRIQLTPQNYPFLQRMPLDAIRSVREIPRSRYGQGFLDFEDANQSVYEHLLENGINTFESVDPDFLQPSIKVVNYALRDHRIRAGSPILRFGLLNGRHVVGQELENAPIKIDGERPKEYIWRRNSRGEAVALRMTLDPNTREYIPPFDPYKENADREIIEIDPFAPVPRDLLKEFLIDAPETELIIPYLVFSKEKLTMPEGMYGLVRSYAYANGNGKETHETVSAHGMARFFDAGRSWLMIFELRGRTAPGKAAKFIDIDLYKASSIATHP